MKAVYSKTRVGLVFIVVSLVFVAFFARLVFVQVVKGGELRERAKRQYLQSIELPAARGMIYDCSGDKVADNTCFNSLFAYPLTRDDIGPSYAALAKILRLSTAEVKRRYPLTPKKFRWIKRGLAAEEVTRFHRYDKGCGLFLREEPTRTYPYGSIGQSILGFVDLDNRGKSGIELVMNDHLRGAGGRSLIQKDGLGEEFRIREYPIKEAEPGKSVVLTVDWDKQQIVEEELTRAVTEHHAKKGMAVFIDPYTGAILAAADYDPANEDNSKPMKLEAVASTFEPGSIFKLITAAAALEDHNVRPTDSFYAEHGRWRLGRHSLRDDHKYDTLSFREGFEFSSNIVMGKIANRIGADRVFAMAQKFGLGRKTRCGLNGESKGVLNHPGRWSQFTSSTFAIGHGMSVTALQMAQAFGVIASGGYLAQPYIIKGCINDEGRIVEQHRSRPLRILDENTAAVLDSFLLGVVERGTGKPLNDAPIRIAGKTGTGEKPNLESGGYHKNRFMASFAGYFPADSPQVAGIVVLDEPEPIHYGGYTAGPAFKKIAIKFAAIDKYELTQSPPAEPDIESYATAGSEDRPGCVRLPDLAGMSIGKARYELSKLGLNPDFEEPEGRVLLTRPAAGSFLETGSRVYCYTAGSETTSSKIPDLAGLTIREAVVLLEQRGIAFACRGVGRVVKQSPEAGLEIDDGEAVQLVCKR